MSGIFYIEEGSVIVSTREGVFFVPTNDMYVGRSLISYGEFSYGETLLFDKFANKNAVCMDIGANLGAHTVHFAKIFKEVLAFEPQNFCFRYLQVNLLLNNCINAKAYNVALGKDYNTMHIPNIDKSGKFVNYGGVSLTNDKKYASAEEVSIFPASYFCREKPSFIKIDVEGMELEVLQGLDLEHKPTLYVENDRKDKSAALIDYLWSKGYTLYWHTPYLFNKNNFNKKAENFWPTVASVNVLAVAQDVSFYIERLEKITENRHIMEKF